MKKILLALLFLGSAPQAMADNFLSDFLTCSLDYKFNPLRSMYLDAEDKNRQASAVIHPVVTHIYMKKEGVCESDANRQRQWFEYLAEHYHWDEVDYFLAITYGYGHFDFPTLDLGTYAGLQQLAIRNDLGDGKNLDGQKGFALLVQAAEAGMPLAQVHLALAYQTGEFGKNGAYQFEADANKSMEWLEKSVASEENIKKWEYYFGFYRTVKFNIAYRLRYGDQYGIDSDTEKAFRLLSELVADKNYIFPDAMVEVALMCLEMETQAAICAQVSNDNIVEKIKLMPKLIPEYYANTGYKADFLQTYADKLQQLKVKLPSR